MTLKTLNNVEWRGFKPRNISKAFLDTEVELQEDDDLDSVYSEWSDHVNMSASELREWSRHPCSREASVDPVAVIRRNLRLLEKNKDDWTSNDIKDAKRTTSFISRMKANRPDSPRDGPHGCPSEWAISMLNWAFNPFDSVPSVSDESEEELEPVDEVSLQEGFKFDDEQAVTWESSGGRAYGVIRDMTDDACYDAAIDGDVEVCGSEENPAYLIQIYDNEKRQLEDTMVAYLEDALEAANLDIDRSMLQEDEVDYEFEPVPDHVVYADRELAMQRAESMGLEGVHEHVLVLGGEEVTMYMPGSEHMNWAEKVNHPRQLEEGQEDEDDSSQVYSAEIQGAEQVFSSHSARTEGNERDDDGVVRVEPTTIHELTDSEDSGEEE